MSAVVSRLLRKGFGGSVAFALVALAPLAARAEITAFEGPAAPRRNPERLGHFTAYSYRGGAPERGSAEGVGLYAKSGDTALDLTSPDRMLDGPNGSLFNQAAGVGWRSHNMSAMFGYMKPSSIRSATQFQSDDYTPRFKSSARVGVGWAMHF